MGSHMRMCIYNKYMVSTGCKMTRILLQQQSYYNKVMLGYIHDILVEYSSTLSYLEYYKRNVKYVHYAKYCQVTYETGIIQQYNWRIVILHDSYICDMNGNDTGHVCPPNYTLIPI